MSTIPLLFTLEEVFVRLGQMKGRGSLLVFNPNQSVHIFVVDGVVVSAASGEVKGEDALALAMAMESSAYRWVPDAEAPTRDVSINLQDYLAVHAPTREERFGKTIKMAVYERKEKKLDFQYFFVPEDSPSSKFRLKKVSNVVGREASCDLCLDSFQVSRKHCLMQITDRGVMVKDLDSTNGTFVNGIPLNDGYINDGDRLSLGTYVLTLRREKIETEPSI
jgi:hypothetical protein